MRRPPVLWLLVLLCLSPVGVWAQGLDAGSGGLGSYNPGAWGNLVDSFGIGRVALGSPRFSAGWMANTKPASLGLSTTGLAPFSEIANTMDFPMKGLWGGLSQPISVGSGNRVVLEGWYLFPANTVADAHDEIAFSGFFSREFEASYQCWFVDGSVVRDVTPGLCIVGGFRYDVFETHLQNSPGIDFVYNTTDEGDIRVNILIPYVGVQTAYDAGNTALLARVIGFPWVGGDYRYGSTYGDSSFLLLPPIRDRIAGNFTKGYFLEFVTEYTRRFNGLYGQGAAGVFVKASMVQGRSLSDLSATIVGLGTTGETFDVTFNRTTVILGGTMTLWFPSIL